MAYGKDYVSAARVQEIEDILYEKIRQKTETKVSEGKTGRAAFKYFDLADSGECNLENFTNALDKFGCKFSPNEIRTLFDKYNTNQSGKIIFYVGTLCYDEFCHLFSAIGAQGPSKIVNPLTTLGKNSTGFNQLKLSQ
jgi:Ca2+-binding EF-hand superfamily protein